MTSVRVRGRFVGDYEGNASVLAELPAERRRAYHRHFDLHLIRGALTQVVSGSMSATPEDREFSQPVVQEVYVATGTQVDGVEEFVVCTVVDVRLRDWRVLARSDETTHVLGRLEGELECTIDLPTEPTSRALEQVIDSSPRYETGGAFIGGGGGSDVFLRTSEVPFTGTWWFLALLAALPLIFSGGCGLALLAIAALGLMWWLGGNPSRWRFSGILTLIWALFALAAMIAAPTSLGMCATVTLVAILCSILGRPTWAGRAGSGVGSLLATIAVIATLISWCAIGLSAASPVRRVLEQKRVEEPAAATPSPPPLPELRMTLDDAMKNPQDFYRNCSRRVSLSADLLFAYGEAEVQPRAGASLRRLARLLSYRPGARVVLEGHADTTGIESWNQTLSEQRAQAIKDWLVVNAHVRAPLVEIVGFGSRQPIVPYGDADAQQPNRRVEIGIICPEDWALDGGQ